MDVTFSLEEVKRWAYAGVDRRCSAMEKGRKGAHGFNRSDFWQLDIEGLMAEAAVAKALGIYYSPVTGSLDTLLGDVLKGVQVRSTKYLSGSLLVHKTDGDDDKFLLLVGASQKWKIAGWILGKDAKKKEFVKTHNGRTAFWVPQEALHPFDPKEFVK